MNNLIRSRRPNYSLNFPLGNGKFIAIPLAKILYIKAEKYTSDIYLIDHDRERIPVAMTIGDLEVVLKPYCFFRNHRSILVNISFIESVDTEESNNILLFNNQLLPIAKRRKLDLIKLFNEMGLELKSVRQKPHRGPERIEFNKN